MSQQTEPRRTPAADVRPGLWATAAAVALMAVLSAWRGRASRPARGCPSTGT